MKWMRNDDTCYAGLSRHDWPDSLEVIGVGESNKGELGRMDCAPFADREDRPLLQGDVYRGGTSPRRILDVSPVVIARAVKEDAQEWDVDWGQVKEEHPKRLPVIARAGGAKGFVEIAPTLDAEGEFIPVGWVECAYIN